MKRRHQKKTTGNAAIHAAPWSFTGTHRFEPRKGRAVLVLSPGCIEVEQDDKVTRFSLPDDLSVWKLDDDLWSFWLHNHDGEKHLVELKHYLPDQQLSDLLGRLIPLRAAKKDEQPRRVTFIEARELRKLPTRYRLKHLPGIAVPFVLLASLPEIGEEVFRVPLGELSWFRLGILMLAALVLMGFLLYGLAQGEREVEVVFEVGERFR